VATAAKLLASAVACKKSARVTKFGCRKIGFKKCNCREQQALAGWVLTVHTCTWPGHAHGTPVHAYRINQLPPLSSLWPTPDETIPYLHIQSPQHGQKTACVKRGSLPSKPEQRKLWLRLWETARKQIKGWVVCKQLQLQPPAQPAGSQSRAAAQAPAAWGAVSPPCAAPPQPETMPFTCWGIIPAVRPCCCHC